MLDLLLLLTVEPPAVQLRGEAPAVVDWPVGHGAMRGEDARGLAWALEVDDAESVISAEPEIGHFGQIHAVTLHRAPSPGPSLSVCLANSSTVPVRGASSPDYPGWYSPEEMERLRADGRVSDRPPLVALAPLQAGEVCEDIDPAGRSLFTSDPTGAAQAIGLFNRYQTAVTLGDVAPPICTGSPACSGFDAALRATPAVIYRAAMDSARPGCARIEFRAGGQHWWMIPCEGRLAETHLFSVPPPL